MIRVVNRRDDWNWSGVYIGRPSAFGNPFVIGRDGTREDVIAKYRDWFDAKLTADTDFRHEVEALVALARKRKGHLNLICWCAPAACHGDVLKQFLEDVL